MTGFTQRNDKPFCSIGISFALLSCRIDNPMSNISYWRTNAKNVKIMSFFPYSLSSPCVIQNLKFAPIIWYNKYVFHSKETIKVI